MHSPGSSLVHVEKRFCACTRWGNTEGVPASELVVGEEVRLAEFPPVAATVLVRLNSVGRLGVTSICRDGHAEHGRGGVGSAWSSPESAGFI